MITVLGNIYCDDFTTGSTLTKQVTVSVVCFNVELTTESYGSEITWSLDTCQSDGTYGDNHIYNEQCCLLPGVYTLTCLDSYGDGWHGGRITILGNIFCDDFDT